MKNRLKISFYLLLFVLICATAIVFSSTYALFENDASGVVDHDIGNWIIKINNQTITTASVTNIVVDNFIYEQKSTIENGYIAPGSSAYFDLVVDATSCDVAVKYDITLNRDLIEYADNITIAVTELGNNGTIRTAENTYSGVITLAQINNRDLITLRVNVTWDDLEAYNESDTELGIVPNNKLAIPFTVVATQYLGETITPYVEPETDEPDEPEET